jgi:hypothetical protein
MSLIVLLSSRSAGLLGRLGRRLQAHLQGKALQGVVRVSDHGLHLLDQGRDIKGQIEKLGLEVGRCFL